MGQRRASANLSKKSRPSRTLRLRTTLYGCTSLWRPDSRPNTTAPGAWMRSTASRRHARWDLRAILAPALAARESPTAPRLWSRVASIHLILVHHDQLVL